MRKALPYDKTLADAFRNTRVVIDVANAAFINGFSVKPIVCFAAGGFVLTNFKADFVRAFGSVANEVIYSDASDLARKLDYFLLNNRRRRDVSREIQSIARNNYTTMSHFTKTIPRALSRLRK
jgi:spore maturation protein CgeB